MVETQMEHSYVVALSERLMSDIRRRGLSVGDRYLTIEAVSEMLGVRRAVAGQAIRQLVARGVLVSKQRSGTFVGPGLTQEQRSQAGTVFILLPAGDPSATHWAYEPFVIGIRREMPTANVQFTFVPENEPVAYVRDLLEAAERAGQFAGVVAVSCPGEVYGYIADRRIPAVVFGELHSLDLPLTSVDADNRECGRLLAEYLIGRGHTRIALVMTNSGRPGDNPFMDGVCAALAAAGLPANALFHRLSRNQLEGVQAMTKELLQRSDRPTAVITRGSYTAEAVAATAMRCGSRIPGDLEVVFTDTNETRPQSNENDRVDVSTFARVEPAISFTEIASRLGKSLNEQLETIFGRPQHMVIPVVLHVPERREARFLDGRS